MAEIYFRVVETSPVVEASHVVEMVQVVVVLQVRIMEVVGMIQVVGIVLLPFETSRFREWGRYCLTYRRRSEIKRCSEESEREYMLTQRSLVCILRERHRLQMLKLDPCIEGNKAYALDSRAEAGLILIQKSMPRTSVERNNRSQTVANLET